jgi:hypothetical protein
MLRPADVCGALLAALKASEGRRRSRKRDQTPDAIGLATKRELLQRAVQQDPDPQAFEGWLLHCALACAPESAGAVSAMARAIFEEWRLAQSMNEFKDWLDRGAPSDDAENKTHKPSRSALKHWDELKSSFGPAGDGPVSCSVELFGVARLLAKAKDIALSLPPEATLAHVYLALAAKLPSLVGRVIIAEGNNLCSGYACNVNGLDFVQTPTAKVNPGDKIFILSADAGG